jgi:putative spermidine/putrescine transport system substrate-binding protein
MLHECGVGIDVFSYVFAYDESRVPKEWGSDRPKTLKDIWDVKRFPGKRGFRKDAKRTLEQALMADGVAPADVYKILATPEGLKRALAKLDEIRDHSIFWQTMAQAPQLLADGEVTIVTAPNSRIDSAIRDGRNFKVIWDGQLYSGNIAIVPKGPKTKEAFELLKFILQPDVLWRQTQLIPYAPSRFSAQKHVEESVLVRLPTHPDNLKNSLNSDEDFWADNYQEYLRAFNNWLAK